jgi:hypothetical protein
MTVSSTSACDQIGSSFCGDDVYAQVSVPPRTTLPAGAVDALPVVAVLADAAGVPELPLVLPDGVAAPEPDAVVLAAVVPEGVVGVLLLLPPQAASKVESEPPVSASPPTKPARLRKPRRERDIGSEDA